MLTDKANSYPWWFQLSTPSRLLVVGLLAPLLVLNAWALTSISRYFGPLFAVVVTASLLAFLLNYPVSWIEDHGGNRRPAAAVVFFLAIALLLGLGVTLVPVTLTQAQQLTTRLPEWLDTGQQQLIILSQRAEALGFPFNIDTLGIQLLEQLQNQLQTLLKGGLNLALGTVSSILDVLINLILVIVLTFYLLVHGPELWQSLIEWLPRRVQQPFSQTLRYSFQNYFLGQLILSTCIAIGLIPTYLLLKVPFGVLFSLVIGLLTLFPFGGTIGNVLVGLLVGLQDIWLGLRAVIAGIVVQHIFENFVAPRIIGSVTGLNPVWVFIAILAGAKISGLLGVVIAVPMTAVIKTGLMALKEYRPQ
jgi:predicted PurR-regulated permease PerM